MALEVALRDVHRIAGLHRLAELHPFQPLQRASSVRKMSVRFHREAVIETM